MKREPKLIKDVLKEAFDQLRCDADDAGFPALKRDTATAKRLFILCTGRRATEDEARYIVGA